MKDYFLNVQDAYRQPYKQCKAYYEQIGVATEQKEVYNIGATVLKLCALPWLAASAYIIGKVAYTRHFSYKGLLLAGVTFSFGHDLSKTGHNLQKAYVMSAEDVRQEDERRNLGRSLSGTKQSEFLLNAVNWCVSKLIAHKVGADKMDVESLSSDGDSESLNARILKDTQTALQGTISQDFMVSIRDSIFS